LEFGYYLAIGASKLVIVFKVGGGDMLWIMGRFEREQSS
jgi:hypothetical protein